MPFEIDGSDTRPVYVQIMDGIRRGIVIGLWRPGEALPSARELAVELRVTPNTVQHAYRELEREGVVEGRRGSGTFVRQGVPAGERRKLVKEMARSVAREAYAAGVPLGELLAELERHVVHESNREVG